VEVYLTVLTDNKNRTAADVRHIFDRAGESWAPTARWPSCSSTAARSSSRRACRKRR
jgi:hypothetical protein